MRPTEQPLMLVELFGAPGAGKSTVANAVGARGQVRTRHQLSAEWHGQSVVTKARLIGLGFAKPQRLIAAVRVALGCRLRGRASIARLCRVIAKSEWLVSQRGLVLLDQGFLQDLWSVLYMGGCNAPDPAHLSSFLRSIFPEERTLILFVRVDPDTALQRITGRSEGHSRLDELPEAELRSSIERTAQMPSAIIEGATAAGLRVVTLDGSEDIDTLAQQILSLLPGTVWRPNA